jgi:hypothetical protein
MHNKWFLLSPPVSKTSHDIASGIPTTIICLFHRLVWHSFASFYGIFKARSKPILDICAELSYVNTLAASFLKYQSFMTSFLTETNSIHVT